jgi:uncharacterized protein (DUF433 family)
MEVREIDRDVAETTEWVGDGIAITRRPGRCGGEPTLAGSRITVAHVVALAHRFDGDLARVQAEGLPMCTPAEIHGALGVSAPCRRVSCWTSISRRKPPIA